MAISCRMMRRHGLTGLVGEGDPVAGGAVAVDVVAQRVVLLRRPRAPLHRLPVAARRPPHPPHTPTQHLLDLLWMTREGQEDASKKWRLLVLYCTRAVSCPLAVSSSRRPQGLIKKKKKRGKSRAGWERERRNTVKSVEKEAEVQ